MANLGSAAEGAFAIALTLYIIDNDNLPRGQNLELSAQNIKYWMKKIPMSSFENGGRWTQTMYNGSATLAKRYGKNSVDQVFTEKNSNNIPVDYMKVVLSIGLKPEEVRGFYGKSYDDSNLKLDSIINQMVRDSSRYKTTIDTFKRKYLTNNRKEIFSINVSTIGKEGEQSGGAIKGDVQLEVTMQIYDKLTLKPKPASKYKFPTLYFSLKASATPPKTISNESPISALRTLSQSFGVDPISSNKNVLISNLSQFQKFTTTASKKTQQWMVDLYGTGLLSIAGNKKFLSTSSGDIPLDGLKLFDLLDDKKFPELWRVKNEKDKFWKSYVIRNYVESVFELIPKGQLSPELSESAWNALFKAGFGIDPYASNTFLLAYGNKVYQSSSLAYLKELQRTTKGKIYAANTGSSVEFYIGTKKNSKTKLYHIRYKNRTVYDGNIAENANFNLQNLLKLELKLMPETGDAFKEKSNWVPGMQLEFDDNTGSITVVK
jgi:hypothetical protein